MRMAILAEISHLSIVLHYQDRQVQSPAKIPMQEIEQCGPVMPIRDQQIRPILHDGQRPE
jgi:hypothetical protein